MKTKSFELNEDEQTKLNEWFTEHNKVCKCWHPKDPDYPFGKGMTGRPIIYHITDDSVGWTCVVECSCGEKVDLSDYANL